MDARSVLVIGVGLGALAGAGAVPRGETPAVPDTPWVDVAPTPPTARYGSFRAARDHARSIVRRALGAWADSSAWTTGRERYSYRDAPKLVRTTRGTFLWTLEARDSLVSVLRMTLSTHVEGAPGSLEIERALTAAGWTRDGIYDADGPDGTRFVMICREALCDVQASWDGGDDSDTTYVAAPGERIDLVCVPRPPGDPRPRWR